MIVAVLGSGNGGTAIAFDWAAAGHEVRLADFPEHARSVEPAAERGVLRASGELEGEAPIAQSGFDIGAAVTGADLVFIVGPAFATASFAEAAAPHLRDGQTVIVCPSSCGGGLVVRSFLPKDSGVVVGETHTLPYAARLTEPGHVHVFLKLRGGMLASALPAAESARVAETLSSVYPGTVATGIWQTTLQNANPVIHPAVTLLNAGLLERTSGDFLFYEEGVTPSVGRAIEAVDRERIAIGAALGAEIVPDPVLSLEQGYMTEASYETGYANAPGFKGIGAPSSLDGRYLTEDIGYGLVFMSDLGRAVGVPTPTMDAIIQLGSVVLGRDFRAEASRTLAALGLPEDREALRAL